MPSALKCRAGFAAIGLCLCLSACATAVRPGRDAAPEIITAQTDAGPIHVAPEAVNQTVTAASGTVQVWLGIQTVLRWVAAVF